MLSADDRLAITELFSRYYNAVDTHDVEGWVQLWTPQGRFDSGHEQHTGHAQLRRFMDGHAPATRHIVSNLVIEGDGDQATAQNYMLVVPTHGAPQVIASAHCRSRLHRREGRWLLTEHVYRPDPSFVPPGVGLRAEHELDRAPAGADPEWNKALVRLFTHAVWVERDRSAFDRYLSPEYVQHSAHATPGTAGVKAFFDAMQAAIPDLAVSFEHLYGEGDRVFAFMRWTGTITQPLLGMAVSSGPVTLRTAEIFRVAGGRIVEHWDVVDMSGAMG